MRYREDIEIQFTARHKACIKFSGDVKDRLVFMRALDTKDASRKRFICLFNSFVTVSGGDILFIEVFKQIKDFDKIVITPFIGRKICEMKKLNATYILTTKETHVKNIFLTYSRRIVKALFLKIEIRNEDVLYSTSDFLPDVLPAFVYKSKNKNAKWVANIYHIIAQPIRRRGSFLTNLVSFFVQRLSFQLIKRYSDLIFVLNNIVVEQLVKLGFPKHKIHVIGAGINLAQINKIPKIKKAEYDACFLGRLHPAKGIFDLIEIWKLVVSKRENARLAIIYAGPKDLELALTEKIRKENLEANVFMLPLTGDDALRLLKSSKIFVFPSHEEGWGIAICEAMACGLPVVAYDLPVYREIFKGGIITVPLNHTKRFSEEVIGLLEDDEKRFALGKKAEVQASKYDWDDVASRELLLMKNI